MGVTDTPPDPTLAGEEWINEYKIQSQRYSRLVTVPQAVEIEVEETIWVWQSREEDSHHTQYLRLLTSCPAESSPPAGETFVGMRSVMAHGKRGKAVTIPKTCADERFRCDSKVGISCCRDENGDVLYLKLIPESVYSSAISSVLNA